MSHAFVGSSTAQVAVVDAFRTESATTRESEVKIADRGGDGDGQQGRRREEDLHFNSVVALGPGRYELSLAGGTSLAEEVGLQTSESSKHVVMRVGMDAGNETNAESYPQELVVFPQVAEVAQKSAASRPASLAATSAGMLLLAVLAIVA